MPIRQVPLVNDQIYHIFNRGIAGSSTFLSARDYERAMDTIGYYRFRKPVVKFSRFAEAKEEVRDHFNSQLNRNEKLVEIYAYCLMPNHFHILLGQNIDNGISKFMGMFGNSYTKYFNKKHKRFGSLFSNRFKSVLIEDDVQFTHISRYIHLNPLTSRVVKDLASLRDYKWSSFPDYAVLNKESFCNTDRILSLFGKRDSYLDFVEDQADYQLSLELIKHVLKHDSTPGVE